MHRRLSLLTCAVALLLVCPVRAFDSWQEFPQPLTQSNLWSIAYGERTLVAVGEQGTILSYRYDDGTWLPADSRTGVWLVGAGYGNGQFVAVGDRGTILTSDDAGATWTPRVSGTSARLNAAVYGGGRWLVVGEQGTLLTSTDGTTWSLRPALGSGFLRALAYGRGRFLIGGAGGTLYTTTDAETFTRVPLATTSDIEGAAIAPDRFFVVGSAGLLATATELDTWQLETWSPTPGSTFRGVTVRNQNEASAVGELTAAMFRTTAPQPAWIAPFGDLKLFATAVTQGLNELVAVGFGGRVARSNLASLSFPSSNVGRNAIYGREVRLGLVSSLPIQSYQWTRNGVDIPGATQAELVFPRVTEADVLPNGLRFTTEFGTSTISGGTPFRVVPGGRPELRDPNFVSALPVTPTLIVPQPDGKLLVAGTFSVTPGGGPTYGLARLNRDGTLDPAFRAGAGIPPATSITGIALLPDGRIYVRGSFGSIGGLARPGLARLMPNGAVDPAFAPKTAFASPRNFVVAPDGGVYVENIASTGTPTISRLTPAGSRDSSFAALANHELVAVDTHGRLLAMRVQSVTRDLLRYLPDGTRDPDYTAATLPFEHAVIYTREVRPILLTERGLYAVHRTFMRSGQTYSFIRYKPDGGPDLSYKSIDVSVPGASAFSYVYRPDGGLWTIRGGSDIFLAEAYSPDGTPEPARYATLPDLSSASIRAIEADGALLAEQSLGAGPQKLIRIRLLSGVVGRLTNLSVRSFVSSSDAPLIVGFVSSGTGNTSALLRAVGPALAAFGVNDRMADPQLTLTLNRVTVATNDQWNATLAPRFNALGAFPLDIGSHDAALESPIGSGDYTFVVGPASSGTAGTVLAELYESSDPLNAGRRFANVSARGIVSPERPHIVGFGISGDVPLTVLIRAAGPALVPFGVSNALPDPNITLYDAAGTAIWENDDWNTAFNSGNIAQAAARTGAFSFDARSTDAAALVTLAPGTYTAVVSGAGDQMGATLLEVYEVP